mgnify:CR=1 FL=1
MKNFSFTLIIVLLAALMITGVVAAALPGGGWWTAYRVQNVGGAPASFEMTAYDATSEYYGDGQPYFFEHGTALVYDPGKLPNYTSGGNLIGFSTLPGGFEGSVVLDANNPVLAAAQVANYKNGSVGLVNSAATGMYQAFSAENTATSLQFPILKNNWSNAKTSFYIQAAGADSNVTMTYILNDGTTRTESVSIEANRMYMFDPSTADVPSSNCGNNFNESPCFGAAVATSDTPIAGVVIEYPYSGTPIGAILVTRGLTEADADTVLFSPSIKNDYFDAVAGATIMNIGTTDAKVKITLTVTLGKNAGQSYVDEIIIPPNASQTFSKWLNNLGGMPPGNFAAAKIESVDDTTYDPQLLIGISNDTKKQAKTPMGYGRTASYVFAISKATALNGSPMVKEYKDNFTGGLTVVNVGDEEATITFTYYEYGTSNVYEFWTSNPVAPDAAVNTGRISYNNDATGVFENDGTWSFTELRNKEFSVIVETDNGEPIVNLVTAYDPLSQKFYDMMNYEGFSY